MGKVGVPISRAEAIRKSLATLYRAEQERAQVMAKSKPNIKRALVYAGFWIVDKLSWPTDELFWLLMNIDLGDED